MFKKLTKHALGYWPDDDDDVCGPETDDCGPDYGCDCMPECGPEDGSEDPY